MSSDNQWTALGPAVIGFQTDSSSINGGAYIAGTQYGAILIGQTTTSSAPGFGAQIRAMNPDQNMTHMPINSGVLGFGEPFGVLGMSGKEARAIGGKLSEAEIPFASVDYGVVGVAFSGPGVLGVADSSSKAPKVLVNDYVGPSATSSSASTGVLGASQSGPGVTGVSLSNPGVYGAANEIGVMGTTPASSGFPNTQLTDTIKQVGVLGSSPNDGVVGISYSGSLADGTNTDAATSLVGSTKDVGVLGVGGGPGVKGVSYGSRGGVFQSIPPTNKLTAQARLVPLEVSESWTTKDLPEDGQAGDLLVIQQPFVFGIPPKASWLCSIYLCTVGKQGSQKAQWAQLNMTGV